MRGRLTEERLGNDLTSGGTELPVTGIARSVPETPTDSGSVIPKFGQQSSLLTTMFLQKGVLASPMSEAVTMEWKPLYTYIEALQGCVIRDVLAVQGQKLARVYADIRRCRYCLC